MSTLSKTGPSEEGRLAPVTYLSSVRNGASAPGSVSAEPSDAAPNDAAPNDAGAEGAGVEGAGVEGAAAETRGAGHRPGRRAANVAVHQLARRGMSRWELAQVLERRGVDERTAAAELDRLESLGLLDDSALAVSLVFTQHTRKGLGRSAIARELAQRHIEPAIIRDALGELGDDDERERALELALKRVGRLGAVDRETARRRLSGYLARKGYDSGVVREAVDAALGDTYTRDTYT